MPRHPLLHEPAPPCGYMGRTMQAVGAQTDVFRFWEADSTLIPPEGARLSDLGLDDGDYYRYGSFRGHPPLREALAAKLAARNRIQAAAGQIAITAGATHALSCATRALVGPGDEVLLLAPFWPLIRGQVTMTGARAVEVPFSAELIRDPGAEPRDLIERYITPRTAAIYFASPNNPDGKVLGARELSAIADLAARHDLWLLADEAYEDFIYDGERLSIAARPGMADRTATVYSFSKSYAMSGLRVGYVVGPEPLVSAVLALGLHSIYHVPYHLQSAALLALQRGDDFIDESRDRFRAARDLTMRHLGRFGIATPEGGAFVFFDLSALAPGRSAADVHDRLAAEGLPLTPGRIFGAAYTDWARLCYTATPPDRLQAGLERLAGVLDRERQRG